jgi:glycosidase
MSHPILYEINTRCWLRDLSEQTGKRITLGTVPESEFARWRDLGFTHIWLMGVWTTGPLCREPALKESGLLQAYSEALPDWKESDVCGSPYAIAEYKVAHEFGGDAGLAKFRAKLHSHGIKLILDFVGNHLGLDHRWLRERPELFVQSATEVPGTFKQQAADGVHWLAHGKDPYFPGWTDTVQLDYRKASTRAAMTELLRSIAERCDGVRCDMAMLMLNHVIAQTWSAFPVTTEYQESEFWYDAIAAVRQGHRDFLFLAEAYWNLEGRLQELGFDYTYDKALYDKIVHRDTTGVQNHLLGAPAEYVAASAHFLENHDEPRVAAQLSIEEHCAAALLILGLPGMRFLHEGQLTGARVKIPVQLARRPVEAVQPDIQFMYERLLRTLKETSVGKGSFHLLRPGATWSGNSTNQNFALIQWQLHPPAFDLVVVNLAPYRSQCYAPLRATNLAGHDWSLRDLLSMETHERAGKDLATQGLYLELPAYGAQLFHFSPVG